MLVRDVMTSPAVTVQASTTVKQGLKLLDKHRVTAMPVTDADGRLVGIVSEIDLLRGNVRHDDRARMIPHEEADEHPRRVEDVMTTLSLTVTRDTDVCDVVELMTSTAVKSLPVVEDGKVVGVVSRSDIVHLLARSDDHIRQEVDEMLRSAGLECVVEVDDGEVRVSGPTDPHEKRVAEVIAGAVPGVISVRVR